MIYGVLLSLLYVSSLWADDSLSGALQPTSVMAFIYCMVMGATAGIFYVMRKSYGASVPKIFYYLHATIVIWSGVMYLHFIFDTLLAPYVYYMDWIVTTPLIVLALALSAMVQSQEKAWSDTFFAMALQALIIITGLFAQLTGPNEAGLTFFALGNSAMLILFAMIWGPLLTIARNSSEALYTKYCTLASYVTIFWIAYPVIWILGTPGLKILSEDITHMFFIILPIFCKAGFGLLDIYLLHNLSKQLIDPHRLKSR